jgi:Fur family ferric uptake transcriptional regulator
MGIQTSAGKDVGVLNMQKKTDHEEVLRRSGLKNTKHRAAILDILEQSDQPMTAEQIYLELGEQKIGVSLSTVYRVMESLADKNLVTKLSIGIGGDNRAYFEYNRSDHRHYLVCLGCKKIMAIEHCPLKKYEEALGKEMNYTIAGHKLDIYGFCPDCQEHGK